MSPSPTVSDYCCHRHSCYHRILFIIPIRVVAHISRHLFCCCCIFLLCLQVLAVVTTETLLTLQPLIRVCIVDRNNSSLLISAKDNPFKIPILKGYLKPLAMVL